MQPVSAPLRLAFVQCQTHWHDPEANRDLFDGWFEQLEVPVDLLVLPEMFSTGFTMDSRAQAETMTGDTVLWMSERARDLDAVLCGSLVIEEGGEVFNRLLWARPDGSMATYDKRHLFRMAGEHEHYAAGTAPVVLELQGWRVRPLVCYDLRFPVWSRNRGDYDLLLVVANWPAPRQAAWDTLLAARAIENLCYAVGVNVVGVDGNSVAYTGGSAVRGPEGEVIADAGELPGVYVATLDGRALSDYRSRFPAWQDADAFELRL